MRSCLSALAPHVTTRWRMLLLEDPRSVCAVQTEAVSSLTSKLPADANDWGALVRFVCSRAPSVHLVRTGCRFPNGVPFAGLLFVCSLKPASLTSTDLLVPSHTNRSLFLYCLAPTSRSFLASPAQCSSRAKTGVMVLRGLSAWYRFVYIAKPSLLISPSADDRSVRRPFSCTSSRWIMPARG